MMVIIDMWSLQTGGRYSEVVVSTGLTVPFCTLIYEIRIATPQLVFSSISFCIIICSDDYNNWARGTTEVWSGEILGNCLDMKVSKPFPKSIGIEFRGEAFGADVDNAEVIFSVLI